VGPLGGVFRQGRLCAATLLLAGFCAMPVAAATSSDGIPLGKGLFYPSVEAVWQNENNLFLSSEDPIPASSYAVRPRLIWELPFRESSLNLAYSPLVREFFGQEVKQGQGLDGPYYSHFVDLGTKLVFSSEATVEFRGEYVVDTFETSTFDAGGEVVFNDNQYRKEHVEVEGIRPVGFRHGIGLSAGYEQLEFDDASTVTSRNYDRAGGGLVYVYKISPLSRLKLNAIFEKGTQERPPFAGLPGREDYGNRLVRLAWQGATGREGQLEVRVGYLNWDFAGPSSDFSGLTGDLRYSLRLGARSKLSTNLSRAVLPSFYNVNSHYVTSNIETRLQREKAKSRLTYFVVASYRQNDYPEALRDSSGVVIGPRREDRIVRAEAGVGYRINDLLQGEVRYRHEKRDSNQDESEYNAGRVMLQLSFGWY